MTMSKYVWAAALSCSTGLTGCAGSHRASAPDSRPVYAILDITVHDEVIYEQYRERIAPVIAQYQGQYIVRSGVKDFDGNPASIALSTAGDWKPDRIIVVKFPSREQFQAFADSPENKAVAPLRLQSSTTRSVLVNEYRPAQN